MIEKSASGIVECIRDGLTYETVVSNQTCNYRVQSENEVKERCKGSVSCSRCALCCHTARTTWGWLKNYMHEQYAFDVLDSIRHCACGLFQLCDTPKKGFSLSLSQHSMFAGLRIHFFSVLMSRQPYDILFIAMHGWCSWKSSFCFGILFVRNIFFYTCKDGAHYQLD